MTKPAAGRRRNRNRSIDQTVNRKGYRVTGWPDSPRPAVISTPDRAQARRAAARMAEEGALVVVERHVGHGVWRTVQEIDGAALARERAEAALAAGQAEATTAREHARQQRIDTALAEQSARREQLDAALAARRRASVERLMRLMRTPPVPRRAEFPTRAAHIAGGRGIR